MLLLKHVWLVRSPLSRVLVYFYFIFFIFFITKRYDFFVRLGYLFAFFVRRQVFAKTGRRELSRPLRGLFGKFPAQSRFDANLRQDAAAALCALLYTAPVRPFDNLQTARILNAPFAPRRGVLFSIKRFIARWSDAQRLLLNIFFYHYPTRILGTPLFKKEAAALNYASFEKQALI